MQDGDLPHLSSPESKVATASVSSRAVMNRRGKMEKMSNALQTSTLAFLTLQDRKECF